MLRRGADARREDLERERDEKKAHPGWDPRLLRAGAVVGLAALALLLVFWMALGGSRARSTRPSSSSSSSSSSFVESPRLVVDPDARPADPAGSRVTPGLRASSLSRDVSLPALDAAMRFPHVLTRRPQPDCDHGRYLLVLEWDADGLGHTHASYNYFLRIAQTLGLTLVLDLNPVGASHGLGESVGAFFQWGEWAVSWAALRHACPADARVWSSLHLPLWAEMDAGSAGSSVFQPSLAATTVASFSPSPDNVRLVDGSRRTAVLGRVGPAREVPKEDALSIVDVIEELRDRAAAVGEAARERPDGSPWDGRVGVAALRNRTRVQGARDRRILSRSQTTGTEEARENARRTASPASPLRTLDRQLEAALSDPVPLIDRGRPDTNVFARDVLQWMQHVLGGEEDKEEDKEEVLGDRARAEHEPFLLLLSAIPRSANYLLRSYAATAPILRMHHSDLFRVLREPATPSGARAGSEHTLVTPLRDASAPHVESSPPTVDAVPRWEPLCPDASVAVTLPSALQPLRRTDASSRTPTTRPLRIAMHVRRGDVLTLASPTTRARFLPDAFYARALRAVLGAVLPSIATDAAFAPPVDTSVHVTVFTEADAATEVEPLMRALRGALEQAVETADKQLRASGDGVDWRSGGLGRQRPPPPGFSLTLCLSTDALAVFNGLRSADVLIGSRSLYAHLAALYSFDAIKIVPTWGTILQYQEVVNAIVVPEAAANAESAYPGEAALVDDAVLARVWGSYVRRHFDPPES